MVMEGTPLGEKKILQAGNKYEGEAEGNAEVLFCGGLQGFYGAYHVLFNGILRDAQPCGYFLVAVLLLAAEAEYSSRLYGKGVQHPFYML